MFVLLFPACVLLNHVRFLGILHDQMGEQKTYYAQFSLYIFIHGFY